MSEEFYIGYLPKAPARLARWLKRVTIWLIAMVLLSALLLVFAQQPFADSSFEFGITKPFAGVLVEMPFPRIGPYLLAGQGKHGVQEMFRGRDGASVKLNGSLIQRDGLQVVEVEPSSVAYGTPATTRIATQDLGAVTLNGEIVDAKCHFGVMNPGQGQVHRDCAVRCLLGGLPAMLVSGNKKMLLEGFKVKENLDRIGVPVEVKGNLRKEGEWLILKVTGLSKTGRLW